MGSYSGVLSCSFNQVHEAESAIDTVDPNQTQEWEPTGTLEQMRKELKVSIESAVEKSVMETQMNKSKVSDPKVLYRSFIVVHFMSIPGLACRSCSPLLERCHYKRLTRWTPCHTSRYQPSFTICIFPVGFVPSRVRRTTCCLCYPCHDPKAFSAPSKIFPPSWWTQSCTSLFRCWPPRTGQSGTGMLLMISCRIFFPTHLAWLTRCAPSGSSVCRASTAS